MKVFKVGIAGCGKQAEKHIQSLQKLPDVEIIVSDIQSAAAEKLAAKFKVAWVAHVDAIFDNADLDAILVCTPTPSHAELLEKALQNSTPVFCEKPLCVNLLEAARIKKIKEANNIPLQVGYLYRHVPVFEMGFDLLKGMRPSNLSILGKPFSAFFRIGGRGSHQLWKHLQTHGGGAINEMLVHVIDLANWYFGPIRDVKLLSKKLIRPERKIQGTLEHVDAEDYVLVQAMGAEGTEIVCQADLITPGFNQYVEIQCENGGFMGSISRDIPSYVLLKESRGGYPSGKTALTNGDKSFLDIQMKYFYDCITGRTQQDKNRIEDSIELMTIIETIRKQ